MDRNVFQPKRRVTKKSGRSGELRAFCGVNLLQARLTADLSPADVAAWTGIQQHCVSEVESDVHNVPIVHPLGVALIRRVFGECPSRL